MAVHPGPKTLRTPRTRALEIGTLPEGFEGQADYDGQGGVPLVGDMKKQTPKPDERYTADVPAPAQPTPFKVR